MNIPMPCKFGESAECDRKVLPYYGVSWFKWWYGMEYTYFFFTNRKWNPFTFYTSVETNQPEIFVIDDELLIDKPIKEHGYPLKGSGHAIGLRYSNSELYVEFLITSNYNEHIYVQCDKNGKYISGGNIIFPPHWDNQRIEKAVLKRF